MDIEEKIRTLQEKVESELGSCSDAKGVEELTVRFLGKKGEVTSLLHSLKDLPKEQKPLVGKRVNELKGKIQEKLEAALAQFAQKELAARLASEQVDISLPGKRRFRGNRHVVLDLLQEAIDILVGMGFSVQYGPDIESDYYNFEALNFAPDHPARDMHDTFYLNTETLLRTHTSNTQVRVMEACPPPIRVIAPGKCFRNEDVSARSHVLFHQIEGFYIDREVTLADLLHTLKSFFSKLFPNQELKIRSRPSYFPFVEPGMEVDICCFVCGAKGCPICKHTGWLEVAGAGMIHPEVLKSGGIDPEEYLGYAWGFGIERLAMLRYGIDDIRLFLENDARFLQQF
ncbi:MAG: Phenylalanine--tRNA ligase alpha subunit [Chlamydiae bacterium]|nr:Phenylalanine--tRNA ligase alpha subunit [Chlamydiota bacterium]